MTASFRFLIRLLCLALVAGSAFAQTWPARPIRFVIPFPPGGSTDTLVRVVQPKLAEVLGQPVVVDYKAGAGGAIGAQGVASAAPDGYTIGLGTPGALMAIPHLSKVPYSVEKDFTYISGLARVPAVIVVNAASPIKTLGELVERARANPGKMTYGHAGNGTMVHLEGEQFVQEAKIKITAVPYRGAAPAMQGLMAGDVDALVADMSAVSSLVEGGKLRALVVTGDRRSPLMPDVPTIAEAGYASSVYVSDYGVIGPAGLPADIQKKLAAAFASALALPAIKDVYLKVGAEAATMAGAQYRDSVVQGQAKWGEFIRVHQIVAD